MSGKPHRSPASPLCRFTFADGRHCRLPAHPQFDGLCYQHGTFRPRASRQDNFLRELSPLANGSTRVADFRRASRALSRALSEERLSPQEFSALSQLSRLIRQTQRYALQESFASTHGPAWDDIRKLIDREDEPSSEDSDHDPQNS